MNSGTEVQTSQAPDTQVQGIREPRKAGGPQAPAPAPAKGSVITKDDKSKA